ncbi:MAG: peptidoglycan DD-metalloendopeptidase family protein [Bacteroidota bacterium]
METFFTHLLKSSGILLVFLCCYSICLKKETFFKSNRCFLAAGLLISTFLPFLTLTKTILVEIGPTTTAIESVVYETKIVESGVTPIIDPDPLHWHATIFITYLIGTVFFSYRLIRQLLAIYSIKKEGVVLKEDNFYHVKTKKQISPFSFFHHIFYHPTQFNANELKTIIEHEKIHARQFHSIDILLLEIVLIISWFNPLLWLYKRMVKQNLEFLADSKTCHNQEEKKFYQYLMLKQAIAPHKFVLANPFFNSLIKKRIVMLNQNQSKRVNALKILWVLPFLAVFLISFNTKEITKIVPAPTAARSTVVTTEPTFLSPVKHTDIKRITSNFGMVKDPYSKTKKFHQGIDIQAASGTHVLAAANGMVRSTEKNAGNGNFVIIDHDRNYSSYYLHLKDYVVTPGQKVEAGTLIGHVGNTGRSTGPHLHFEIRKSNRPINPQTLISFGSTIKATAKTKRTYNALVTKNDTLKASKNKRIELTINKDTSDEELEKIKKDLSKDGIDFLCTVIHNDTKEIIDISIQISGKNEDGERFGGNYSSGSENPIKPITMVYDGETNSIFFGHKNDHAIHIHHDGNLHKSVLIARDGLGQHNDIVIKKERGAKKIIVDGEEISEEVLGEMDINIDENIHFHFDSSAKGKKGNKKVRVSKQKKGKSQKNVIISKDSDDENDIEFIGQDGAFFFIDTDGGKDPLFLINGKESTRKQVKKLSPDKIETIEVSKGEGTLKKYGRKAEHGVVEVTTKQKNQ